MKTQVHIKIVGNICRGKTTTALEMLASAMKRKNTSTYYITDELTSAVIINRLASMGAFNDASNLPVILASDVYEYSGYALDELMLYISNECSDKHSYIVIDVETIPTTMFQEYINKIIDVLNDKEYTIVTTVSAHKKLLNDDDMKVVQSNKLPFMKKE